MRTKVRISHILVRTEEEVQSVYEELCYGGSFKTVVREKSICSSSEHDGDLGFFDNGSLDPAINEIAFTLPVGKFSEPINCKDGWRIIYVTDSVEVEDGISTFKVPKFIEQILTKFFGNSDNK